ncbi:L-histidine N(alpha)-methyltransferase [Sphingomonas sp. LHG3406-1]|uniref:L-histidine N(alpha)-methyltransferase n=1 Tax=Sphingomonas sp. LHG3406-1 TaxID=2804617 RepID=UPI00263038C6|nr:L-histidine N(alpha)-methyltransferase [Sphingomonas sp. LHG3406-1]
MLETAERSKQDFARGVLEGLAQEPPAIAARWLYDDAGSALFDDITDLPEYYPTRTEIGILRDRRDEIAAAVGPGRSVIDYGAGSLTKTPLLIEAVKPAVYVPVDISGPFLRDSAAALGERFPDLPIHPVEADFTRAFTLPAEVSRHRRLGFFPGSTIGNFVPESAVDLLRSFRTTLGTGALLLIGFDRLKDERRLVAAYDDAAGTTAAFNRNLLERMNRDLGADVDVEAFAHEARWNERMARIEMHLVARRATAFMVAGHHFHFEAGETIHTENSHKYTLHSARLLLLSGGWTPLQEWSDANDDFSLILARSEAERFAP